MAETPEPKPTTEESLLGACLELVGEVGFSAATTKAIAARAGVNEVTVFRRFSTKSDLMAAALAHAIASFRASAVGVSDELEADLVALAEGYAAFVHRWPNLVARLLPELAGRSAVGEVAVELMAANAAAVRALFQHHVEGGRLVAADPDEAMVAFLGPILVGATLGPGVAADGGSVGFDASVHVHHYLHGRSPSP